MPTSINKIIDWQGDLVVDSRREGIVGANDFQQPWFLRLGWERSRLVAVIPNMGTCFLIGNNTIMTNWHVLRRVDWANGKSAVFDYEQGPDGLVAQTFKHMLNPEKLFYSNEALDFAVCFIEGSPGNNRGFIDISVPGSLTIDSRINIIQHPGAELKKIAIRNNGVKYFDESKIQYWTDTEHGSSGSPLFNDSWDFVGLHFLFDDALDESGKRIFFNVGTRADAILKDINANGVVIT